MTSRTFSRTSTRLAANASASATTLVPAAGVKEEAGAARFAALEAPPYREIRGKPFDAAELSELKKRYMLQRRRDALQSPKAPVDNHPVIASVIRDALRERDEPGALVRAWQTLLATA